MLSDFHFLNPEWFLALLPLAAILWGIGHRDSGAGAWQRVVDPGLLPHLLVHGGGKGGRLPLVLLAIGWLAAVIALANPTFERLPVPAYRGELARVVILDLSRSMETPDLEPSRLARARYKVADILERSRDGQAGLIAFAGAAFIVSPLTDDADTILAMLDAVVPEIMPVQGSRPDLALAKAVELLAQAGSSRGEVVLVGDDAGGADALAQARALTAAGHSLSVIGVGTGEGGPVPGVLGADERPVLSVLDTASMQALAAAGGGVYAPLSADGKDLDRVLRAEAGMPDALLSATTLEAEVWRELGPWVLLAILPLGALAFRRGWLLAMVLLIGNGALVPEPAMASIWDDLWQRRDQQAAAALKRGDHEQALDLADQPLQRGTASYRLGDYEAAAEAFDAVDQADGHYNFGNALARAGRLEEAVAAYEQALVATPDMEDAAFNKALVEEMLKQQQEQQQEQQSQGEGDSDENDEQDGESQEQQSSGQSDVEQNSGEQSQDDGQPQQGDQGRGDQQSADAKREDGGGEQEEQPGQGQESAGSGQDDGNDSDPAEPDDAQEAERAAADYREEAAGQDADQQLEQASAPEPDELSAEDREAQQAANQWLRRIPDDPAGLLRRKFLYQYRSRAAQRGAVTSGDPW